MKKSLSFSHLGILLLTVLVSSCSTPSKKKKDDSGQFKDDVSSITSKSDPELHSSSALLLKYQERIRKRPQKKERSPASVESAESFLEETEEDEETEFNALIDSPEKNIDKKEETLASIEGEATDEEIFQDTDDGNNNENDEFLIDTPNELKNIFISDMPSPFEIKELPPELKKEANKGSIFNEQKKESRLTKEIEYQPVFPHQVPVIKEGSLLSAAKRATVETLRYLLERGLNINYRDSKGNSALHYAVFGKRYENIKYLLKKGADPLAKNNQGLTPKEAASKKGKEGLETLFP